MTTGTIRVDSDDRRIDGWYAGDIDDLPLDQWRWNDRGNGPELVRPPDVVGPYATEAEAVAAAASD